MRARNSSGNILSSQMKQIVYYNVPKYRFDDWLGYKYTFYMFNEIIFGIKKLGKRASNFDVNILFAPHHYASEHVDVIV